MSPSKSLPESKLLLILASVQFVSVLDFMMVMPLGPDFARGLGVPNTAVGIIGGSYTAAAALSGVAGAFVLDRFERRVALVWSMVVLTMATAAGGLAVDLTTLLLSRVAAGASAGFAGALAMAIITDAVAPERRGRALGTVMAAYSVASVFGVPAGLELARLGGFRVPFFFVAGMGAIATALCQLGLPAFRSHLDAARIVAPTADDLQPWLDRTVWLSLATTALVMVGSFLVLPSLSAYLTINRAFPRERLGLLYLIGGAASLLSMRAAGRLGDRFGAATACAIGNFAFVLVVYLGFISPSAWVPAMIVFPLFMVSNSFRFVPMQALFTRVPSASGRGRFMSLQSFAQHSASALGAFASSRLLEVDSDGALVGMELVAWITCILSVVAPLLIAVIQARLERRDEVGLRAAQVDIVLDQP